MRRSKLHLYSDGNCDGLPARHQSAIHSRPIHSARAVIASTVSQHHHAILEPYISMDSAEQTSVLRSLRVIQHYLLARILVIAHATDAQCAAVRQEWDALRPVCPWGALCQDQLKP